MSATERVVNDLNTAKLILCNPQMLTTEMCIRIVQAITSALALLKEDCHNCKLECLLQKYDQLKEKYDKLLKEQETVEPIPYHRSDGTIFKYECRQCRTKIFKMDLFCRHCGQAVKWNDI